MNKSYKEQQKQTHAKLKERKLLWSSGTLDLKIRKMKKQLDSFYLIKTYKENAWWSLNKK